MTQSYFDASYPPSVLNPQPPVLTELDPDTIVAGDTPTLVTITGTGFTSRSVVWADEEAQETTYVNATTLTYMAEADQAGAQDITVQNGGVASASLSLTVTEATP